MSSGNEYDNEYGGEGRYDYNNSTEISNPVEAIEETDLNPPFTNADTRNSLDSEYSGDIAKDTGVDLNDTGNEHFDSVLDNFQEDKWSDLSLDDQKQSMAGLAEYVAADTGNKNPPEIVFRGDMADGTYGGYNPETNTMEINENMLGDSAEAVDTVAHEMWHAHQQQCALDPACERGREYREGFDNYISPEYDFEGYQNQMVETEAREYAQGFKDRLAGIKGGT
jgi:hypothetical protein